MERKEKKLIAAALQYDSKKNKAPKVTAKGRGIIAEKIIEMARKHDIPIKNDPSLIHILSRLDIDEEIPVELYRAVAEVMAFVYTRNEQKRQLDAGFTSPGSS
jgi:flagellar biosynthesis protein